MKLDKYWTVTVMFFLGLIAGQIVIAASFEEIVSIPLMIVFAVISFVIARALLYIDG